MSSRKNKELFEAICFFGKKSVVKEMRYSEFEAVLDGVVGISELANKEVNAAFVKITPALKIHSVVTFQIEFDSRGFADEDWNIPLRHLADSAGPGPDLGAGPIRLACRSQCAVSWYQRELWEPNQQEINHFKLMIDAIKRNKLGLISEIDDEDDDIPVIVSQVEEDDIPLMSDTVTIAAPGKEKTLDKALLNKKLSEQAGEFQKKVDLLIARQRQTLQGLDEKYKDEIDQVKRAMRNEAQSYRHRAQELEQQANQNKVLLEKLQTQNVRLDRDHGILAEQSESQKEQYDELKDEYLALLRNQRSEDDNKTQEVVELKEQLTAKSVEMDEAQDEAAQLRAKNVELSEKIEAYQQQLHDRQSSNSTELNALNQGLEDKQNEIAELRAKVSSLEGEHKRMSMQLDSSKTQVELYTGKAEAFEANNQQMQETLKKAELQSKEAAQGLKAAKAQIGKLQQEMADLENAGADLSELYDRLEELELVFVAYHPGAGHISLPARQLEDYLAKPLAMAAQKCAVTLEHYKAWLVHYESSECEECGVPVKRIDLPSDFQPGTNDRCARHRVEGGNVAMFRKSS